MFLDASVSYFSFLLCCHNSDFLNACPQNETWYFKLVMTLSSPFHIVKFLMQLQISSETCSRQRNQRSSFQHLLDHRKSKRIPEKHLLLLHWLKFWLCDHNKLENSSRDGNTRPLYLSPEKPVCGSRSNSGNWTMEQLSGSKLGEEQTRLCIVTLLI